MNLRIMEELDDPIDCYLGLSPYTFKILSKHNLSHYPRFRQYPQGRPQALRRRLLFFGCSEQIER